MFPAYIAIAPLLGLFGYLWLPKRKKRHRAYIVFLLLVIPSAFLRLQMTTPELNFFLWGTVVYMLSELIWLSLKRKNKILKILFPSIGASIFVGIAFLCLIGGIAGLRIFPPETRLSKHYQGIKRYEIVRIDHFDTGVGWSNYLMRFGIRGIPISYSLSNYYGGKGIRDEVNRVEWKNENKQVAAILYVDEKRAGEIRN